MAKLAPPRPPIRKPPPADDDFREAVIEATLTERGNTHGLFADNGYIAGNLRSMFRTSPNWNCLSPAQQLTLDEIALKIARLLSSGSNNNHKEHWLDIAGYATMGWKSCQD